MTRSMTTVERYIELRSRLDELDSMAEHVPPARLAERLVDIVSKHMESIGSPVNVEGIRERVAAISPGKALGQVEEAPSEALLEEPVTTKPGPPAVVHEEPKTIEIPQGVDPEPSGAETSGETEKPCKDCGETKPLSEFPKNGGYKDGHTNKCKPCTREYRRQLEQDGRDRREERRERRAEISVVRSEAGAPDSGETKESGAEARERSCANGERCVAVSPDDLVPTPATLDPANPGPLCRRCQQRAGVA